MMRPLLRLLAGLVAALFLIVPGFAADRAIIVLDASGSMWAQIDGRTRIEIARDSLKQVLAGVPSDLELGFMAYGHRSKGDCKDIEMLVEPAPGTAGAIAAAADKLNPKGKTPLSAAVEQAADALKYTEDKATVILITDGIETCDADPCALASSLEQKGVDLTVDVVGFGLSDAEGAQVRCLADNTGGQYIQATDSDGLQAALKDVVETVTAPPAPASSSEQPVSDTNFTPSAVLSPGGPVLTDADGSITWELHAPAADGGPGEWRRTEYGSGQSWAIEPGKYVVIAKLGYAQAMQTLDFQAGVPTTPQFNLNAGYLDIRPLIEAGGELAGEASIEPTFPGGASTTVYGEFKGFVPAGETKVKAKIGAAVVEDSVSVAAGERVTRDVVIGAGHLTASASYVDGMAVDNGSIYFDVFEARKDINGERKEIAGGYGPVAQFDLPAGDYALVTRLDAVSIEQPFSIEAAAGLSLDVPLNAGVLAATVGDSDYLEVFSPGKDINGNRKSFGGGYGPTISRTLPAGDYHLVLTVANDGGTKQAEATVKAGERTETTFP